MTRVTTRATYFSSSAISIQELDLMIVVCPFHLRILYDYDFPINIYRLVGQLNPIESPQNGLLSLLEKFM